MGVLKLDDISPDGVFIAIDWGAMRVGSSVFVPCLNTTAAKSQIRAVFGRRDWGPRFYIGPESGIWGVRVWRVS